SVVTATYGNSTGRGNLGFPKPVAFIHLTVGHYWLDIISEINNLHGLEARPWLTGITNYISL
ncbi:MAG: hypothetical protein M1508_11380, partial [Nitrospirae bacterium]|nr:hypothetical protein [Nitrospirota bacterium]